MTVFSRYADDERGSTEVSMRLFSHKCSESRMDIAIKPAKKRRRATENTEKEPDFL
jgi:hypothetical protein